MEFLWLVRVVAQVAGGALAAKGFVAQDDVEVIAGAAAAVAGVVASGVARNNLKKQVQ